MILSDSEIIKRMGKEKTEDWIPGWKGDIVIKPFDRANLGPNSYDVTLADTLLVYTDDILDSRAENHTQKLTIPEDGLVLIPGRLYLGATREYTETHNLVPMFDGRSSFGRLGLLVHITAGFGDAGFCGTWTLELVATHPLRIYPGQRIGQLFYHTLSGEVLQTYSSKGGKYQNQTLPRASESWKD